MTNKAFTRGMAALIAIELLLVVAIFLL